jgi:uncharacterized protein (DUF58 family)
VRAVAFPRFTVTGRAVLGGSIVVYAAGWVLGHRELVAVAVVGLVAVALALPWGWVLPRGTVAERSVSPERVSRGDPAEAHLRVRRGSSWRPALVLRDRVAGQVLDNLVPRREPSHDDRYPLPTGRRGVVTVGPLSVVRSDPLGLVSSERRLGGETTLWVYPRVHTLTPLGSGRQRDLEGPTEDRASGSITFHALREYVPGDDLRLVHWPSTARTGTLMVRQQVDPSQPHTTVVLDTRRSAYESGGRGGGGFRDTGADDLFEEAVDVAASLVVASTSRRFPVRLLTTGGLVAGGRSGQTQARPLLDDLTMVELSGSRSASLADIARTGTEPAGRSLVVVTGRPPDGELTAVEALGRQHAALAVVRVVADATPSAVRGEAAMDVVAPDAEHLAALWRQMT